MKAQINCLVTVILKPWRFNRSIITANNGEPMIIIIALTFDIHCVAILKVPMFLSTLFLMNRVIPIGPVKYIIQNIIDVIVRIRKALIFFLSTVFRCLMLMKKIELSVNTLINITRWLLRLEYLRHAIKTIAKKTSPKQVTFSVLFL